MPYSDQRVVHDADAHIMETPTWLATTLTRATGPHRPVAVPERQRAAPDGDPDEQLRDLTASFEASGPPTPPRSTGPKKSSSSWRARTSPPPARSSQRTARALDLLGFSSQLVFNTFHNRKLHDWEHSAISTRLRAARATTAA